ncbi:MAG: acyltransferase [Geothrix sp.]|uniref:acyltransferase n=1 Tax=Geothrix sp. TaxID=1962974 RepID=UPI0017EC62EF|nr:acyltransferase [Geothrix sp.]NWJ40610.1 acyltransferase [Geothrix sp.]WIL21386.1 MAG: acyltransferase [Geothrix sp.]
MLKRLGSTLKGSFASSVLAANTIAIFSGMIPFALLKLALPFAAVRRVVDRVLMALAQSWVGVNGVWMALVQRIRWDVQGLEGLRRRGWYLVSSNHQSWVDILVLQKVLHRRVPFLKFFLKRQLLYVPVMGLAWWALDFPFMKRRSGSRSADLATARKACEKFRLVPTSVMNFLEGTRFSRAKHDAQQSPYRHLLKPKVGGLATALSAMGERFDALLDVTIVYPGGVPTFWDLLSGKVRQVVVRVRELEIPKDLLGGDYEGDPAFRARMQTWVQAMWADKDARIEELVSPGQSPAEA